MTFTVELTADQVATLERLQFPNASLADKVQHMVDVAIGNEEHWQELEDNPPPHLSVEVPF